MNQSRQYTTITQTTTSVNNYTSLADEAVYLVIHSIIDKMYTDQTGRFPITSSRGHKYIMIMYHYKTNAILAEPIKSRQDSNMIKAYNNLIQRLTKNNFLPSIHFMGNEASTTFRANLKKTLSTCTTTYTPLEHCRSRHQNI